MRESYKMELYNFKRWSQLNKEAEREMKPDLGLRDWDSLVRDEKQKIWDYLKSFFVGEKSSFKIMFSVYDLNENFKYKSYGKNVLKDISVENAREDFINIFFGEKQHVVFELISYFCQAIIKKEDKFPGSRFGNETQDQYEKRVEEWVFEEFDAFKETLNDVFEQFGIDVYLARCGFILRQDKKITEQIYDPVLNFLSAKKWGAVSRELGDAFKDYQAKTEEGYSSSITHSISALEAFLQVSIYGVIGKGTLSGLMKEAAKKKLIPDDSFSRKIFDNIESILAQSRKETGDAHPKIEYANEKTARLILNITMIFLQHCMQM